MPHELKDLVRVRELRARLARIEVMRLRQSLLRAEAALAEARQRKAEHEASMEQASALWLPIGADQLVTTQPPNASCAEARGAAQMVNVSGAPVLATAQKAPAIGAEALATGGTASGGGASREAVWRFSAFEAHGRMAFVAAARLRIQDAEVLIRRTRLARQRAHGESDEASQTYRSLQLRRETLAQELARQRRKQRLRRAEREDELAAEDRALIAAALRSSAPEGSSDE